MTANTVVNQSVFNIFKVLIKYLFLLWVGAEGKKSSESESDQLNEDSGL